MKKMLVLLVVLILAGGVVFAQDSGFSLGVEFGIEDINEPKDAWGPYLMPMLIYENSFLNGAVDINGELDYTYEFTKTKPASGKEYNPQKLDFDLGLGVNFELGYSSTLSLLAENENSVDIAPKPADFLDSLNGTFTPGIKFTQGIDFGDIYAQADVPITYRDHGKVEKFTSGLNFTAGWDSSFGFGIKVKEYNSLTPASAREWFTHFDVTLSYETDFFYGEVLAEIPRKFADGVTVTPTLECYLGSFTFYGFCEFDGIAAKRDGGIRISPGIGVKVSF